MASNAELSLLLEKIQDCCATDKEKKQNDWVRYVKGEMTEQERELYIVNRRKEYVNFTESECGKIKTQFLNRYLNSEGVTQLKFKEQILTLFKSGELATLAVRLKSKEIIDLALDSLEPWALINNDFRDDIVSFFLVYYSIKKMNLKPEKILMEYVNETGNKTVKNLLEDYNSREVDKRTLWCMGYEVSNENAFGFVYIGGDADYSRKKPKNGGWKFW